jgi:monoamine oxidase
MEQEYLPSSVENIIIGAGIAGITTARLLQDVGEEVVVLEATDRLGGRIFTSNDGFEWGAEFIHGDDAATWKYIRQFGLQTEEDGIDTHPYIFEDNEVKVDNGDYPSCDEMIARIFQRIQTTQQITATAVNKVLEAICFEVDYPAERCEILRRAIQSEHGARLGHLSLRGMMEPSSFGRRNYRLTEGYGALVDKMGEGVSIHTETPIERIAWKQGGATVFDKNENSIRAKRVISTIPIGEMHRPTGGRMFSPALPPEYRKAFSELGAGRVWKIIVELRKQLCPPDMSLLRTSLTTQVWWPVTGKNGASGMSALVGPRGIKDFGKSSKRKARRVALQDLSWMFGEHVAHEVEAISIIPWARDPYCHTGYSFERNRGKGSREILQKPIQDTIYFAGEATVTGTVAGAIESAERVVAQILNATRKPLTAHLTSPLPSSPDTSSVPA